MVEHRLIPVLMVLVSGCAQVSEAVEDRAEPLIRQAIAEKRVSNDRQFERWRLYRELSDLAGCNLSIGAIDRNATEAERAVLDGLECR